MINNHSRTWQKCLLLCSLIWPCRLTSKSIRVNIVSWRSKWEKLWFQLLVKRQCKKPYSHVDLYRENRSRRRLCRIRSWPNLIKIRSTTVKSLWQSLWWTQRHRRSILSKMVLLDFKKSNKTLICYHRRNYWRNIHNGNPCQKQWRQENEISRQEEEKYLLIVISRKALVNSGERSRKEGRNALRDSEGGSMLTSGYKMLSWDGKIWWTMHKSQKHQHKIETTWNSP